MDYSVDVSVIVPIYKTEKYLKRCIDSIIGQTFTNLEIILVNDGSPDGCLKICRDYEQSDSRVIVIDKPNGGVSDARNCGIDRALGEYLYFVDSDDYIHPQTIEILYDACKKHNCDISMCDILDVYDESEVEMSSFTPNDIEAALKVETRDEAFRKSMTLIPYVVVHNKLYRSRLFTNIRFPIGKIHEDEFVTYKLIFFSDRLAVVNIPMDYYIHHDFSIMSSEFSVSRFNRTEAFKERADFCISNNNCVEPAIRRYLCEYKWFIKNYSKYEHRKLTDLKLYKQNFRTEMSYYEKWISRSQYIKLTLLMTFPELYKGICKLIS